MSDHCIISAECGINHGGSIEHAFDLVEAAKSAGADIAKFQTYIVDRLLRRSDPDYDALAKHALPFAAFQKIKAHCDSVGIEFCSTPGDVDSLWFLVNECGVKRIKIGSDDLMNRELVGAALKTRLPVILSTGMATLGEVANALLPDALNHWNSLITLLHCVSLYPCPLELVNLRAMDTMREAFQRPVGYSDHTGGIEAPVYAALRGACMVEKHLMLRGDCIDSAVSVMPHQFESMVWEIRDAAVVLGDGVKAPGERERAAIKRLRKGADGLRGG